VAAPDAQPVTPAKPPLLFLSHAGVDTRAALELVNHIEQTPAAREAELKVWIDRRDFFPRPWLAAAAGTGDRT
jgi:hypothetical protein